MVGPTFNTDTAFISHHTVGVRSFDFMILRRTIDFRWEWLLICLLHAVTLLWTTKSWGGVIAPVLAEGVITGVRCRWGLAIKGVEMAFYVWRGQIHDMENPEVRHVLIPY